MKLRAPAYPLVTVDPYFSLWSMCDELNGDDVKLWTGKRKYISGYVYIDGEKHVFMGKIDGVKKMKQEKTEVSAFSTVYTFSSSGVRVRVKFTTPVLPDDLDVATRPISYIEISQESIDGNKHRVKAEINVSDELCKEEWLTPVKMHKVENGYSAMKVGSSEQTVLGRSGDNVSINWGWAYLAIEDGTVEESSDSGFRCMCGEKDITDTNALFVLAYDDIYSITYFGERLEAYWKRNGETIEEVISKAFQEYGSLLEKCRDFDGKLDRDAKKAGGEKYSDLLRLALRQVMAAHKAVLDKNGKLLFISKECFSNGCAGTVDIMYPSSPMFLLYNTELVKGMLRPVLDYSGSGRWKFDFAPHDLGRYPILNGQIYGGGENSNRNQMPVEESGNMLITVSALSFASGNTDFAEEYFDILSKWADYLVQYGFDPEEQLCTDDFAGHLAHNCNLSVKAIVAIGAFGTVCKKMGKVNKGEEYLRIAKERAERWVKEADNGDGTFRLTFDRENTFSMKYNMVWDRLMNLGLFPQSAVENEVKGYKKHFCPYGLPLDSRADYTKSDWLVWTATLADGLTEEVSFDDFISPLWTMYNFSPARVPLTDWYSTVTSMQCGFQHRSVQGGLFIKLLELYGTVKAE